jgi:tRNA-splicing endonuclease subunit Sen2
MQMWELFCRASIVGKPDQTIRADNPFILSYVVYHHFRSLGWVVRSGIKFCADWVLYGSRGPVGGHAELRRFPGLWFSIPH